MDFDSAEEAAQVQAGRGCHHVAHSLIRVSMCGSV